MMVHVLKSYGVGRRTLDDQLFSEDKPPSRLGIHDVDEEILSDEVIKKITCHIPSCKYLAESLLDFESHYNSTHRYTCSQCKKVLPSPYFLDLHIQEKHDSFFAVMAAKKPSYLCYIEECKEKFLNPDTRLDHCVKVHKLPKDFRFDLKPLTNKGNKKSKDNNKKGDDMDLDSTPVTSRETKFSFNNSKSKAFSKYSGKKFTSDSNQSTSNVTDVNMDDVAKDLKESLP